MQLNRRQFLAAAASVAIISPLAARNARKKPNIILCLAVNPLLIDK